MARPNAAGRTIHKVRKFTLYPAVAIAVACAEATEPAPTAEPPPPNKGITGISVTPGSATLSVGDTLRHARSSRCIVRLLILL